MNAQTSVSPAKKSKGGQSRRKSRELALKAVYRGMINASELRQVFLDAQEDPDFCRADDAYFRQLVSGVREHLTEIDADIADFVDRPLAELSPVEHAILRIAGYELKFDVSVPYRVVINEGVELAKLYGGTDGHKYINGVLDKVAARLRPHEVKR